MSEKDDSSNKREHTGAGSEQGAQATVAELPTERSGAPAPRVGAAPPGGVGKTAGSSRSGGRIGWLALLLVLALAGAAGWSVKQGLEREQVLKQRIAELEAVAGGEQDMLSALERGLKRELENTARATSEEISEQASVLEGVRSELERQLQQHAEQVESQGRQLAALSASDQDSWLRAEAQYLLRLANQRVIMARDTESALALLDSADAILRELDDRGLYAVRAAVAAEKAALRAVPKVDVEGTYLRLSALIEQADQLVIFQMPEKEAQPEPAAAEDWQGRLQQGYREAASKLSDYIAIRRRDVPMQVLMDPQWEGLVRQNLRMLLEQAQVALLSRNQALYTESLARSQHWVAEFFETDEAAARAMAREISLLEEQTIQVAMPDLTGSLEALDVAVKRHLQRGGDE